MFTILTFTIVSSPSDGQMLGRYSDSTPKSCTGNLQKLYHAAKYLLFSMATDALQS